MAQQYVAAATLVEKFGKLAAASITLGFGKELRCKLRRLRAPAREIAAGKKIAFSVSSGFRTVDPSLKSGVLVLGSPGVVQSCAAAHLVLLCSPPPIAYSYLASAALTLELAPLLRLIACDGLRLRRI